MIEPQTSLLHGTYAIASRRQPLVLAVSVACHLLFFASLLHAPAPKFLAPSFVVRGERTGSTTVLYFSPHGSEGSAQAALSSSGKSRMAEAARITWTRARNNGRNHEREVVLGKTADAPRDVAAMGGNSAPPLGSAYGSLSQGATSGFEIRPALWASGSDPLLTPGELDGLEGTVIVEITIDEQGNVVGTSVLQSLSPAIDIKVVAALQNWRFHPATRDGVAVASKQDVYYHFPLRR